MAEASGNDVRGHRSGKGGRSRAGALRRRLADPLVLWAEDQIFRILTPQPVVVRQLIEKGMKRHAAVRLVMLARARWKLLSRGVDAEQVRAEIDSGLRTVYAKAMKDGDSRTAVAALGQLRQLWGLDHVHVDTRVQGSVVLLDPEAARKRLEELRKRQGGG